MIRGICAGLVVLVCLPAVGQDLIVAYDFEGEVGNLFALDKSGYVDDMGMPVTLDAILDPTASITNDAERGDVLRTGSSGFGAQTLYDAKLEFETSFALQAWIKTDNGSAWTHIAGRPGSGPRLFNHWGLGALGAAQRDQPWITGFEPVNFGPGGGQDGQWHHLLITWNHTDGLFYGYWDGINGDGTMGIDGDSPNLVLGCPDGGVPPFDCPTVPEEDWVPSSRLVTHPGPPGLIFSMGGNPVAGQNQLANSLIDDVALWNGFATAEVAAGLFNGTYSIYDAPLIDPGATAPDGDFNDDGNWDCVDINALTAAIAASSTDLSFDMNQDGSITAADITDDAVGWLAVGGANNTAATGGNPFLVGDATLDGIVDGLDFIEWNTNKFTTLDQWCGGDFTADGVVDGLDFIEWNTNKFTSSNDFVAVPEPSAATLLLVVVLGWCLSRRNAR